MSKPTAEELAGTVLSNASSEVLQWLEGNAAEPAFLKEIGTPQIVLEQARQFAALRSEMRSKMDTKPEA